MFHHLPPSLEAELANRLGAGARQPPPQARIAGVIDLGRGTAFRVESPELEQIRATLADAFRGMLTPQDNAPWRPHVTIQNKVEPRDAKRLQAELRAGFEPRPLKLKGLASWYYRGGPWDPIARYSFRG